MSIYKVIGNYYTDLLDFLGVKYKRYSGELDRYFADIKTLDKKKELIDKIAYVFQRVEILKQAERKVWENRKRTNVIFMIIMCIMMVAVLIILTTLCIFNMKSYYAGSLMTDKIQGILIYFISFLILFTVLLLIVLNMDEGRKRAGKMMAEVADDVDNLKQILPVENKLRLLLVFVAYKNAENKLIYDRMIKTNGDFIRKYTVDLAGTKAEGGAAPKSAGVNLDINYNQIFTDFQANLLTAVKDFYADGRGYVRLRKELVASSNILILSEMRRIMRYYNGIIKRKINSEALANEPVSSDKVLSDLVIPQLMLLNMMLKPEATTGAAKYIDPTKPSTPDANPAALVLKNESDTEFMLRFQQLRSAFFYLATYLSQIYLKKSKDDVTFDPTLKAAMPTDIDLVTATPQYYYAYVKGVFEQHFSLRMETLLQDAKKTQNMVALIELACAPFMDMLVSQYLECAMFIEGDYYFIFNGAYMESKIREKLLTDAKGLDAAYVDIIMGVITRKVIPDAYAAFQAQNNKDARVTQLVNKLGTLMMNYDISLSANSKYLLETLNTKVPTSEDGIREEYMSVMRRVDELVLSKRAALEDATKQDAALDKFLTMEEFNALLDKTPYSTLKKGMAVDFFKDILDKFYFSVSNAVYTQSKTSKDIYFGDEKKFKLARIALIMTVIIVISGLVYNTLSTFMEWKIIRVAKAANPRLDVKVDNKNERREVLMAYGMQTSHVVIKMVVPWAAALFFLTLLYSFYKKGVAKYRFNKDTIDSNTAGLRTALQELQGQLEDMDALVGPTNMDKAMKDLPAWNADERNKLYRLTTAIVDKAEKCNFILSTQKAELPFPYTEAIVDMFMLTVIIVSIVFIYGKINPVQRFRDIRYLNKMKDRGQYDESDAGYQKEVSSKAQCHDTDMDTIIFTIKVMFYLFVVMFLVFYATKVITSTSDFEFGLYTSRYYEESKCYE